MHEKTRKQCARAMEAATQWRIDNNMDGVKGFVMTYGKNAIGFSERLPEIERRNPICVDEEGDCFSAFQKNCWSCLTTPEKLPPVDSDREHISSVAQEMLIFCYPDFAEHIAEWFAKCRIPTESGRWTRMERASLGEIFKRISEGVSADHFLTCAYGQH